jgi:cell division protease FtsH
MSSGGSAGLTIGLAGADLANVVNEAALTATRRRADAVTLADFTQAIERVLAGVEKKTRVLSARDRAVVAFHEMGHAQTAMALPGRDAVHKVSIIPHGIGALGYTLSRPSEDRYIVQRGELENKIAVLLGGRAAEQLVFGEISTDAADDIARATAIAHDMVTRYGMDEGLGHVSCSEGAPRLLDVPGAGAMSVSTSPQTAERIDRAVQRIVQAGFVCASDILATNRDLLDRTAQALLAKETPDEAELAALVVGLVRCEPHGADAGRTAFASGPVRDEHAA